MRTARDRSAARSDPASGSDHACAQTTSPRAIGPSTRVRCSAVPWASRVGASRLIPFCETRPGAPAAQYSSSNASQPKRSAPRPPYSSGQETADHPPPYSSASHARCAANPSLVSREGSGRSGTWSRSQARARTRSASVSAVRSRSMTRPPSGYLTADCSLTSVW
ncbi:hypothetical protein SCALM49S_08912 [Streptomyces californicus]